MLKEFLINNLTYTDFGKDDMEKYGNYLVDIINKLQAPAKIQDTLAQWNEIKVSNTALKNLHFQSILLDNTELYCCTVVRCICWCCSVQCSANRMM